MKTTEGPSGNLFLQRPFLIIILVSMQRQESILDTELTQNVDELYRNLNYRIKEKSPEEEQKTKLNNMIRSFISSLEVFGKIQLTKQGRSTISENRESIYSLKQSQMEPDKQEIPKINNIPFAEQPTNFDNYIQIIRNRSEVPTTDGKSRLISDSELNYISNSFRQMSSILSGGATQYEKKYREYKVKYNQENKKHLQEQKKSKMYRQLLKKAGLLQQR